MFKTLVKKQFYESFKGYFINNKTGKAKSKAAVIGMFILFAFIMFSLAAAFFGMSLSISMLLETELSWLYYAIFGVISIALGTFASVFNTSNSLYNAKDNDLLLSMPIKPSHILLSRITLVYGLSIMYISVAWLPICITPIIFHKYNPIILISDILLLLLLSLFVTVLSCAFGYIVAIITNKTKNKSILTVLLSLAFLGAYYFVCFKFEALVNVLINDSEKYAMIIVTWANLIYQLALGALGRVSGLLIFALVTVALWIICYRVLNKSFYKIVINSNKVSSTNSKIEYKRKSSVYKTLLAKEFKRFIGSPIYLLNMGLGCVFVIAVAIGILIKRNDIGGMLTQLETFIPNAYQYIPLLIIAIPGAITSMCAITVPSISLEGKNLWILKSLPIHPIDIINAKRDVQFVFVSISSLISAILMCFAFKLDYSSSLIVCIIILMCTRITSNVASFLSLINPNFSWTNEAQPIKQALNVLVYLLISFIFSVGICSAYYLFRNMLTVDRYINYLEVILIGIHLLLQNKLNKWGTKKFETL